MTSPLGVVVYGSLQKGNRMDHTPQPWPTRPTPRTTDADRHRVAFASAGGSEVFAALAARTFGQRRNDLPTPVKKGTRCSVTVGGVTATGTVRFSYGGDPEPIAMVRLDGTGQLIEASWNILGRVSK